MRKIIYLIVFWLLLAFHSFAEEHNILIVNLLDGTSTRFHLSEQPRITFTGGFMSVLSGGHNVEFSRSEVKNYVFLDNSTSVENLESDNSNFIIDENTLILSSLADKTTVRIYSIDGKCITTGCSDECGTYIFSLQNLPAGIYIINYNNTTIKYLKK